MRLFAGIDGGQTSTVAVVADGTGRELGRGTGPAADLVGEARGSRSQAEALDAALDAALSAAKLPAATSLAFVVAGISGYEAGCSEVPALRARAEGVRIAHDAEIAHAGAFGDGAGIVAVAGTGSVVLGNAMPGGRLLRAGGWGAFFGDEGSALALARDAIRRAMREEDAGRDTPVAGRARAFFGVPSLRAIQQAFAHGELDVAAIAAFAPEVCALAADGCDDVRDDANLAAAALVATVRTLDRRLGAVASRRVVGIGGLFRDPAFARRFAAGCGSGERPIGDAPAGGSALTVVPALGGPADGALRMAIAAAAEREDA